MIKYLVIILAIPVLLGASPYEQKSYKMDCYEIYDNFKQGLTIERCENKEVICYSTSYRLGNGTSTISCKYK